MTRGAVIKKPGKYHHFADREIHELTAQEIWELIRGDYQDLKTALRSYAKRHGLTLSVVRIPDDGLRFRMWEDGGDVEDELSAYLPPELVERERQEREDLWLTPPRRSRRTPTKSAHADCDHPSTRWERHRCRTLRQVDAP